MTTLLIDADFLAVQAAFAVQKEFAWDDDTFTSVADLGEAKEVFEAGLNKIANAGSGTEHLISQFLWQFFPWIVGLAADLNITYLAHPYFALALVVWMAVYIPLNVLFVSRLHRLSFKYAESSSQLRGQMVDSTSNIDAVRASGEVEYEKRHIGEYVSHQRVAHLREWWWSEWVLVTNGALNLLLVPLLGMQGAAIASATALAGSALLLRYIVRARTGVKI